MREFSFASCTFGVIQRGNVRGVIRQGRKKPTSDCLGQVTFAFGQVKMEIW